VNLWKNDVRGAGQGQLQVPKVAERHVREHASDHSGCLRYRVFRCKLTSSRVNRTWLIETKSLWV
jgi:hypothetical protein